MPEHSYLNLFAAPLLWPVVLSAVSVCALVVADYRHNLKGKYLFKPLAATAFVWLALLGETTVPVYGQWLISGLVLCMVGDIFLMFDNDRSFLLGLSSFALGHGLYAVAFLQLTGNTTGLLWGALPALVMPALSLYWLNPYLQGFMQAAVVFYILVISTMLFCAFYSWGLYAAFAIIPGAVGFAISDLAVARQQFVSPGRVNGLWGTPLYFISQMILAFSITLV